MTFADLCHDLLLTVVAFAGTWTTLLTVSLLLALRERNCRP